MESIELLRQYLKVSSETRNKYSDITDEYESITAISGIICLCALMASVLSINSLFVALISAAVCVWSIKETYRVEKKEKNAEKKLLEWYEKNLQNST